VLYRVRNVVCLKVNTLDEMEHHVQTSVRISYAAVESTDYPLHGARELGNVRVTVFSGWLLIYECALRECSASVFCEYGSLRAAEYRCTAQVGSRGWSLKLHAVPRPARWNDSTYRKTKRRVVMSWLGSPPREVLYADSGPRTFVPRSGMG
jgi:hypothetical protein